MHKISTRLIKCRVCTMILDTPKPNFAASLTQNRGCFLFVSGTPLLLWGQTPSVILVKIVLKNPLIRGETIR